MDLCKYCRPVLYCGCILILYKWYQNLIFNSSCASSITIIHIWSSSCWALNASCFLDRISFICPPQHDDEQSFCCTLCLVMGGSAAVPRRGKVTIATKVICIVLYFLAATPIKAPSLTNCWSYQLTSRQALPVLGQISHNFVNVYQKPGQRWQVLEMRAWVYHLCSNFRVWLLSLLCLSPNFNSILEGKVSPTSSPRIKPSYSFGRAFLGLDKCNACIGTSICKKFFKEEIRSESS